MAKKVLVYPYGDNPYQRLLYECMLRRYPGLKIRMIRQTPAGTLLFPLGLLLMKIRGYHILHIHWATFGLSSDSKVPAAKVLSFVLSAYNLFAIKMMKYCVVWTVHNVLPHETLTCDDEWIAKRLSLMSSKKIVHSKVTIDQMKAIGLDVKGATCIPHGNYIGVYPNTVSRDAARRKLGLKDEFVVLFFGEIRAYKGVDSLIRAIRKIGDSDIHLLVAGRCLEPRVGELIVKAQSELSMAYYEGYQSDQSVEVLFKACDVVCLPFERVTTSGSAILALSFGKPIVAPRCGALSDLPDEVGFLYDPEEHDALEKSIRLAMENGRDLEKRGMSASAYATSLSWDKIADATYGVYEEALLGQ